MAPHAHRFARYEGFDGHANAVSTLRDDAFEGLRAGARLHRRGAAARARRPAAPSRSMRAFDRAGPLPGPRPGAMVATSHPASTDVGLDVLKAGGNALDAAIAACAMQCVVEPGSTGIGGDCFAMLPPKGAARRSRTTARAARRAARRSRRWPRAASTPRPDPARLAARGRRARRGGRVDDAAPRPRPHAVRRAAGPGDRRGARRRAAALARRVRHRSPARPSSAPSGRCRRDPPGGRRGAGRRQPAPYQPALADALEAIAREGRDPMYAGDLAARHGRRAVLARRPARRWPTSSARAASTSTPISAAFRDLRVWECPPNGQGLIALLLLRMFDRLAPSATGDPLSPERMHREIEACRLRLRGQRTRASPIPRDADVPVDAILSDAHVDALLASDRPRARLRTRPRDGAAAGARGHRLHQRSWTGTATRAASSTRCSIPFGSGIVDRAAASRSPTARRASRSIRRARTSSRRASAPAAHDHPGARDARRCASSCASA